MDLVLPTIDDDVVPIYLDSNAEVFCVVDRQDYDFAQQWRWKLIKSRGKKLKYYAFRTTRWEGRHIAYFLHKLICFRAHGLPPTINHIIADHQDGNSLNNRRSNLEWATRSENSKNRHGINYVQMRMAVTTGDPTRFMTGERGKVPA